MPIEDDAGNNVFAFARDIGNYAAGYEAGINGFSWKSTRKAFDLLNGSIEPPTSQRPQRKGYDTGLK